MLNWKKIYLKEQKITDIEIREIKKNIRSHMQDSRDDHIRQKTTIWSLEKKYCNDRNCALLQTTNASFLKNISGHELRSKEQPILNMFNYMRITNPDRNVN